MKKILFTTVIFMSIAVTVSAQESKSEPAAAITSEASPVSSTKKVESKENEVKIRQARKEALQKSGKSTPEEAAKAEESKRAKAEKLKAANESPVVAVKQDELHSAKELRSRSKNITPATKSKAVNAKNDKKAVTQ